MRLTRVGDNLRRDPPHGCQKMLFGMSYLAHEHTQSGSAGLPMRAVVYQFARVSFGYSLVSGLAATLSFLLLPLYTHVLTPAEYGVVDLVLISTNLVIALVICGLDQALNALFFDGDHADRDRLSGAVLYSVVTIGFVVCLCYFAFSPLIARALFGDEYYSLLIRLFSLNVLVVPFLTVLTAIYRLRLDVVRVNSINGALIVVNLTATTLFLVVFPMGISGIALAAFCTQGVVIVLALLLFRSDLRLPFHRSTAVQAYATGVTLLPATLSWLLLAYIDRFLLLPHISSKELGLYSLANRLAMPLSIIFTVSWNAWLPMALAMIKEPEAPRRYAKMFELLAVGSMVLALTLGLFTREGLLIISREEYWGAATYAIVLMVFTGPLTFIGACFNIAFYAEKNTYLITVINLVAVGLNIALNLLLNPLIGVWGAVLATLGASFISVVFAYILSQRLVPVMYRWANLLPVILLYALLVGYFAVFAEVGVLLRLAAIGGFLVAVVACDLIPRTLLAQSLAVVRERIAPRRSG